jgi:subtilase family serine protease
MRIAKCALLAVLTASLFSALSYAAPDRIAGPIESTNTVELKGHVSPMARPEFDQGRVEPTRALQVTMLFIPTAAQQQAMSKLLAAQQDPKSEEYHKWLTPEQYGDRFGLSQGDLDKIRAWLEGQGFKVTYVARGRDYLSFDGVAAQVESVFKTEIHYYNVNGKMHFANATPPSIPVALSGIVGGFRGLHDFGPHSMLRKADYTLTIGSNTYHFLAPDDIATIYDITPLYQLSPAIDGTGQKVVVAGQSDVYLADLHNFRTLFGLSDITGCTTDSATHTIIQAGTCTSGNFEVVWPGADPGVQAGDVSESDLDIEWVGSVARGTEIIFVTSPTTSGGVDTSAAYAIDQQLAPVVSYSYGLCEAYVTAPNISTAEGVYQKAATEGISFFAAAGDSGAAECDGDNGAYPAQLGLSVSYPASSPEVTGVGGTEFDEDLGTGPYWGATNGTDGGSAQKYIPEYAWNDSAALGTFDATGGGPSNCANGTGTTVEFGYAFELCDAPPNGGFAKPSWQSGITPADGVRDVPDIAFSASNVNDAYLACVPASELGGTGSTSSCANGIQSALTSYKYASAYGGTSASTPVAAGLTVLMNQYLGAGGLGTINQELYTVIYKNTPSVFHDIVGGTSAITGDTSDNIVPCVNGDPTFEPAALRCAGTTMGYSAGTGYDLVTGLGSVDIDALATAWAGTRTSSNTTVSFSATVTPPYQSEQVTLTATVTPSTAAGNVTFSYTNGGGSPTTLGSVALSGGTAQLNTSALPVGTNTITATYNGNATYETSSNTTTVTVVQAFTLQSNAATYTVTPGQTATVNITVVTNGSGFSGNLTYTCSEPATLSPTSTCTGPKGAIPSSQGASFMITTTAPSGDLRRPFDRQRIFYAVLLPGLMGIMLTFGSRKRALGGMRMLGLIMVLGFSTLWLGSCGGNNSSQSNPGTPAGTYIINISATSGSGSAAGATGSAQPPPQLVVQ